VTPTTVALARLPTFFFFAMSSQSVVPAFTVCMLSGSGIAALSSEVLVAFHSFTAAEKIKLGASFDTMVSGMPFASVSLGPIFHPHLTEP